MDVQKNLSFTLTLSLEEAAWLRALVQNPLVENESDWDKRMRMMLFNALDPRETD